jgi:hypothetical protein
MKKWSRRLAYLFAISLWLILMSFPIVAYLLATRGELMIGQENGSHLRVFLVDTDDYNGVGLEWSRSLSDQPDCFHTRMNYLLWEGRETGQNVEFCICRDRESGFQSQPLSCPNGDPPLEAG